MKLFQVNNVNTEKLCGEFCRCTTLDLTLKKKQGILFEEGFRRVSRLPSKNCPATCLENPAIPFGNLLASFTFAMD